MQQKLAKNSRKISRVAVGFGQKEQSWSDIFPKVAEHSAELSGNLAKNSRKISGVATKFG